MPFTLLPAVDHTRGRLGVLTPAGPEPVGAFGGDPVAAARAFAEAGARWLHVVDMDLAFGAAEPDTSVLAAIGAACPGVDLQASGGVRTWTHAAALLGAGAARVVVGSAAYVDPVAAGDLFVRLGPAAVAGIEVDGARIRPRGTATADLDLIETVGWLAASGVPAFLVTAVARVGSLRGPDVETVRRIARSGRPTLAAGGIRSVEDLEALRAAGAVGAVVGRAAIEEGLPLDEALRWAAV